MILVEEDITEELGKSKGMKRTVIESVPSDIEGKIIVRSYIYLNPPSNKGWGALAETKDDIVNEDTDLEPIIKERLEYIDKIINFNIQQGAYKNSETLQYVGEYVGNYRRM